jgi:hypothetical protein
VIENNSYSDCHEEGILRGRGAGMPERDLANFPICRSLGEVIFPLLNPPHASALIGCRRLFPQRLPPATAPEAYLFASLARGRLNCPHGRLLPPKAGAQFLCPEAVAILRKGSPLFFFCPNADFPLPQSRLKCPARAMAPDPYRRQRPDWRLPAPASGLGGLLPSS